MLVPTPRSSATRTSRVLVITKSGSRPAPQDELQARVTSHRMVDSRILGTTSP
jgi:hypothetical protein